MSKSSALKGAIQNLKINAPFDLRKQGQVGLKPPAVPVPKAPQPQAQIPQVQMSKSEPPQKEVPRRKGYFRVRHDAFADRLLRDLSGDAFRLFLWMSSLAWRYPDSDGSVRASVGFIERGTGISHATISRALAQLRKQSLVELLESDFKRGNLWKISSIAVQGPENEPPQFEPPLDKGRGTSKGESSDLNLRQEAPQFEGEVRNTLKKESKNSLSSVRDGKLREYFEQLKPARKAESELQAFWELRAEYCEVDLALCLEHLLQRGVPGSGDPCHSPMAYLSRAIGQIIRDAKAAQEQRQALEVKVQTKLKREQEHAATEVQEEMEFLRREASFVAAFPSQEAQRVEIARYLERYPYFNSDGFMSRRLAIHAWWNANGRT